MLFTKPDQPSYMNNLSKQVFPTPGNQMSVPFSILSAGRIHTRNMITTQTIISNKPPVVVDPAHKKMKWGEPIWNLFHVLAEKVKESEFPRIRSELLNVIYTICSNLPCPDCANHAIQYLNDIHYKNIQTKEQLKNMLFRFHNEVNARKLFPLFPREQLEEKYSKYALHPVLYQFMAVFQDKHKSIRMIADDFHRTKIAQNLKQWFNDNIFAFNH